MAYAKIVQIYEDGIRDAEQSRESWRKFIIAVGEAVLRVCLGQIPEKIETLRLVDTPEGLRDDKWKALYDRYRGLSEQHPTVAPVFNHSNCINLIDTVHSTQTELYLWSSNCLRRLYQVEDDDLAICRKLIDEEMERRKESQAESKQ